MLSECLISQIGLVAAPVIPLPCHIWYAISQLLKTIINHYIFKLDDLEGITLIK